MAVTNSHSRMFKKSNKDSQIDLFGGIPSMLEGKSKKQFDDTNSWHNQFRIQIISRIDEMPYKVLFNEKMGAPNAPVSLLIGMMVLKEAMNWSDSQLFEQCRFNLLVRSSLGLFNMNDPLPVESTYYLFRKRIYEHNKKTGKDLFSLTFDQITQEQIKDFEVNGKSIRMDSKLIGSNIAYYSRYEIIHQALYLAYKSINKDNLYILPDNDKQQLEQLFKEEPQKTVYRCTRDEIKFRMQQVGALSYKLIKLFDNNPDEPIQLLKRIFEEQFTLSEDQKVEVRPSEKISPESVQSPHDPDSTYRHKGNQKVKGYSTNVTETNSDDSLNLITNVDVKPANTPDTDFVQPSIEATTRVTGQPVEKVYADGAYQSPDNDTFCNGIDMVFTGMQGPASKYMLDLKPDGLHVTDLKTGQVQIATPVRKQKNTREDRWYIITEKGKKYFGPKEIRASQMRMKLHQRPAEELRKRNNVEATIFLMSYLLHNNKTRYRGIIKQQMWANSRALWINLRRIIIFSQQTCQRTYQVAKNQVESALSWFFFTARRNFIAKFNLDLAIYIFLIVFTKFTNF